MARVKVIEAPSEVYWETTHEGTVEIDGTIVEFRYNENSNGINLFIFEEELGWTDDPSDDLGPTYDILFEMLSDIGVSDLEFEEEFDWDA
jgi:hypothetical protein